MVADDDTPQHRHGHEDDDDAHLDEPPLHPSHHQDPSLVKKIPGTWTPLETIHLIDAYREKWYALNRGQLRTAHWEEVAESLAARCAGLDSTKTSVQCRHKMEKLRRKYRAERQVILRKGPGSAQWPYYERMDLMERGPAATAGQATIPAQAICMAYPDGRKAPLPPYAEFESSKRIRVPKERELPDHESTMSLDEDAEDSDQPPPDRYRDRSLDDHDTSYTSLHKKRSRSTDYEAAKNFKMERFLNPRTSSKSSLRRQQPPLDSPPLSELVSVIRTLGERFLRLEQMKLQMQRESERLRDDLEARRTEMFLESQKQIAEMFAWALSSSKKSKKSQTQGD